MNVAPAPGPGFFGAMAIEDAQRIHRERVDALRDLVEALPWNHPQLTLEIGCGHGHFLTAYASAHPDEHCVAVDINKERVEKALRKSTAAGLSNVTWIRASADDFFAALPAHARFNSRVFILFPDPWPKRKHWKNRLIQPAFLDLLAARSTPGTEVCFRTDHDPYFAAAAEVFAQHAAWEVVGPEAWPFEHYTVFKARADSHQSLVARHTTAP